MKLHVHKTGTNTNVLSNWIDNVSKPEANQQNGEGDNNDAPYTVSNRTEPQTHIRSKDESLKLLWLVKELTPNSTKFDSMHISDKRQEQSTYYLQEGQHFEEWGNTLILLKWC